MSLFQSTVVAKYLNTQETTILKERWQSFQNHFHNPEIQENIRNSKEEQYQGEFLIDLFVNVLGYTKNPTPNFNLTTEYKNVKDSKKADGAIIFNDEVKAVIELKGTETTDLTKVETQAFGYKNNQPKCKYVITSNFEKLRLYIDNATEHLELNLFTLTEKDFGLLYLCLAKENVEKDIPQKLKNESLSKEGEITKQLYKDYSLFKRELHKNLVALNPQFDPLTLFKKSQKLLDRFLFLFFAEDRSLLPPNSVRLVLSDWKELQERDVDIALYERFKKYFGYLNNGFKGKRYDVYPYNGGLFKPDNVLDTIIIDDTLLYNHTLRLSEYDFASEVDVNILGHIFENSLTEIEEVEAELTGQHTEKTKSKRKKDGVFYTPKYITKYIVEKTVGKLCEQKKAEFDITDENYQPAKQRSKKRLQNLQDYREWLLKITICDPACGSGAFLNQALDFLIDEHKYIDELSAKYNKDAFILSDVENSILENNLFGVDINEESVQIARLSLWLRTAQKNRKLNDLSNNIKCGNSLIDDSKFAGTKAFKWADEFISVFADGGFDIVIGNPPYVRAELLTEFMDFFENTYKVYHPSSDLFAYFYELGSTLIKPTGRMGFISNTFDKTSAGKVLREYLQQNTKISRYIDFTEVQIFEGATTYPVIIILDRGAVKHNEFQYFKIPKSSGGNVIDIDTQEYVNVEQSSLDALSWSFASAEAVKLFCKLKGFSTVKEIYGKCYYGVKTALNEAFIIKNEWKHSKNIKPILEGKEIKKWNTPKAEQNLILFKSKWTKNNYGEMNDEWYLNALKSDFPLIMEHLLPFQEKAIKRYDKGDFWWELRNCAYYDLFEQPKIIFPNLQNSNKFSFDSKGNYINAPAVFVPTDDLALLCVLNSKIVWEFLKSICVVRSGGYIEVKPQYFEQIPIPALKNTNGESLRQLAETIISKTGELQETEQKLIRNLNRNFEIEKLSKKLENWSELTFNDFVKELKKKKVSLSLSQQAEWEEYFLQEQLKAQSFKNDINKLDAESDTLVYSLYGLTEEEIKIVEGN